MIRITGATVNMQIPKYLPRRFWPLRSGLEFEYLTCSLDDFYHQGVWEIPSLGLGKAGKQSFDGSPCWLLRMWICREQAGE